MWDLKPSLMSEDVRGRMILMDALTVPKIRVEKKWELGDLTEIREFAGYVYG